MSRKKKIALAGAAVVLLLVVAAALVIKSMAPPGEEWIAYQNEAVIASIDQQLDGIDIEQLAANKEKFILEKNVHQIQQSVEKGDLTYEEVTALYLYRIKTLDQKKRGLNAVTAVAPDAIQQARERDAERLEQAQEGLAARRSPLFGIPVMLKDNINTAGIPTSAGAEAFARFVPERDAAVVTALKKEGAVILGKNNLSEFANFLSSVMPSGYSGAKGQTVNPFNPIKLSPSGSSSGSAVAVTANLSPVSIGTETAGSIIAPAAVNSVVGFKPSRSRMPGEGIFPLISKVDTAGPMGKTVADAAAAYSAISGEPIALPPDGADLKGTTIGFCTYAYADEAAQQELKQELERQGARVVDIRLDESGVQVQNLIALSFKQDFEAYADQYGLPIKKLAQLIEYNKEDKKRRARYGQDLLEAADTVDAPDLSAVGESIQRARAALDSAFQEDGLDAIAFLNSSGSTLPAAAGYPALTVPFKASAEGVPQGATFVTKEGEDQLALSIGAAFEQRARGRLIP